MYLQEKEEDNEKHMGKMIRKNPKLTGAHYFSLKSVEIIGFMKDFTGKKFQSIVMGGKRLLT